MSRKKISPKISFIGGNASDVTGSMILIETEQSKILLEAGLFQSNNIRKDFEINNRRFAFKPKDIDFIFCNHTHIDHIGLLPRLYKEGCQAQIIMVKDTSKFASLLLTDSAFIMQRDAEKLGKETGKVNPLYGEFDVHNALAHIIEFNFNELYALNDEISFEWIPAGHIIRSAQLRLYIKQGNHTYKLLYTSDIGNIKLNKPFTEKFEAETKTNIVIGECTYADNERAVDKKDRLKDIEKMKSVIEGTCKDRKARVLIPSFSMDRTQFILKLLYDIFGKDETFDIPIIVDSPLSCKITEIYKQVLDKEELDTLNEVLNWKNLKLIKDSDDSKACVADCSPKVIISASGMMVSGRSRFYTKAMLPDSRSTILFCGFASPGSLAGKIKDGKKQKTISIDGKPYPNRCSIVDLKSFSSHMQHEDLLNYYSNINCEKIYLVHSNFDDKVKFAKKLQRYSCEMLEM
jgi:metallo-beta-lactamase family protein